LGSIRQRSARSDALFHAAGKARADTSANPVEATTVSIIDPAIRLALRGDCRALPLRSHLDVRFHRHPRHHAMTETPARIERVYHIDWRPRYSPVLTWQPRGHGFFEVIVTCRIPRGPHDDFAMNRFLYGEGNIVENAQSSLPGDRHLGDVLQPPARGLVLGWAWRFRQ